VVSLGKEAGHPDLEPLSVFLDEGVVPRASRDDNYNVLGADLAKYLVVRPGDIVFNKLRTWQGGLGMSRHLGIVSPAYYVCRPDVTRVEPRYLHHLLRSSAYLAELTRISKWMPPAQFDVLWEDLRALPILMPPLRAQRAIADKLDRDTARIDALLLLRRTLLRKLEERRACIIYLGVTGLLSDDARKHDPGIPWATSIRRPWLASRIKHVAHLGSGHTPSRSHPEYWEYCTIPWITTGEIRQVRDDRAEVITETREKISEVGLANSAAELHPAGTVVLCRTASAGYSAIMGTDMATSQDFVTWTCSDRLLPRYLLMCLRAMRPDLLGRLAFGSTHKTIYMPDVEGLKIPLPSVDEQREILEEIDRRLKTIDALVERIQRQLRLLSERRQALITAAVTGQIDVTERTNT
jgi:type I restriction enzyme S subunit